MKQRSLIAAGLVAFAASAAAVAESTRFTADLDHTAVISESKHFGTSTTFVKYAIKSGAITIDPAAQVAKGTFVIDINSLQSNVPKLNDHLKSPEFFNAAEYPEATFVVSGAKFSGDKVTELSGSLAMAGKVNPVTLTATNYNCYTSPMTKKFVCGGDFDATIQRTQWGIKYLVPLVSDETRLHIQIEATKD